MANVSAVVSVEEKVDKKAGVKSVTDLLRQNIKARGKKAE